MRIKEIQVSGFELISGFACDAARASPAGDCRKRLVTGKTDICHQLLEHSTVSLLQLLAEGVEGQIRCGIGVGVCQWHKWLLVI